MTDENKRVQKSISLIKKHSKKNSAVSVSGGKDSLVVLDLGIQASVENFVFSNAGILETMQNIFCEAINNRIILFPRSWESAIYPPGGN